MGGLMFITAACCCRDMAKVGMADGLNVQTGHVLTALVSLLSAWARWGQVRRRFRTDVDDVFFLTIRRPNCCRLTSMLKHTTVLQWDKQNWGIFERLPSCVKHTSHNLLKIRGQADNTIHNTSLSLLYLPVWGKETAICVNWEENLKYVCTYFNCFVYLPLST